MIVQAEHKESLFALLRRSLSSAKIIILFECSQFLRRKVCSFLYFNRQVTPPILSYIFPVLSVSVPLMDSCTIQISNGGDRSVQDSDCELECQQQRINDAAGSGDTVYGLFSLTVGIGFFHQCFEIKGLYLQANIVIF